MTVRHADRGSEWLTSYELRRSIPRRVTSASVPKHDFTVCSVNGRLELLGPGLARPAGAAFGMTAMR